MAFDKSRFIEYVNHDTNLCKELRKNSRELHYTKDRFDRHKKLRDMIRDAVQEKPKDKKEELDLMQRLVKLEKARVQYAMQTQFLLLADYIDTPDKVQAYFPVPKKKKKKKKKPQQP